MMNRLRTRLAAEEGTALVIALMAVLLLTALGATVVMVTNTETKISANHRNSVEALYAADAAVERVVEELLMVPRWNDILTGTAQSAFSDGARQTPRRCPAAARSSSTRPRRSCRPTRMPWRSGAPTIRSGGCLRGGRSPTSRPAWKSTARCTRPCGSPTTRPRPTAIPTADTNGTLTVHAEALGPFGTRKVIEVTVARTSSTEIERGQIAQRGQEELNQRARKAAVQTPGKSLSNMKMNVGTGT